MVQGYPIVLSVLSLSENNLHITLTRDLFMGTNKWDAKSKWQEGTVGIVSNVNGWDTDSSLRFPNYTIEFAGDSQNHNFTGLSESIKRFNIWVQNNQGEVSWLQPPW